MWLTRTVNVILIASQRYIFVVIRVGIIIHVLLAVWRRRYIGCTELVGVCSV